MDVVRDIAGVCADPHLRARRMVRTGADGEAAVDFPVVVNGRRSVARDRLPDPAADEKQLAEELRAGQHSS
jgi:crotonobetainyl-CoA:carnitine CoA-transferase CaiB-like acyl-CoA transferase